MTTFRYKPDKIKYLTSINTLDTQHRKRVTEFESRRKRSADIKNEISKLENDLCQLENPIEKGVSNSIIDIKQRSHIKTTLQKLKQDLYDIENNISELEYYSQTNDILLDYYYELIPNDDMANCDFGKENSSEKIEEVPIFVQPSQPLVQQATTPLVYKIGNPDESETNEDNDISEPEKQDDSKLNPLKQVSGIQKLDELNQQSQQKRKPKKVTKRRVRKTDIINSKSILDFFSDKISEESEEEDKRISADEKSCQVPVNDANQKEDATKGSSIEQEVSNKATLFDYYMTLIDKSYVSRRNIIRTCTKCNVEKTLIQSEGFYVCQNCGEVEHAIIESEVPSHKDSVIEKHIFPYKRMNHLSESQKRTILIGFLERGLNIIIMN